MWHTTNNNEIYKNSKMKIRYFIEIKKNPTEINILGEEILVKDFLRKRINGFKTFKKEKINKRILSGKKRRRRNVVKVLRNTGSTKRRG